MAKKSKKKTASKARKTRPSAPKKIAKKVVKKAAKKNLTKASKNTSKKTAPVKKKAAKKINKKLTPITAPRHTSISPYLTFAGNCEEAFHFYQSVFGGKFNMVARFGEMPTMEGQPPLPESEKSKIMHISLPISKESILMGSDSSEAFGQSTLVGNNFSISVNAASQKSADHLFNGLSAGGHITMPIAKTFWGSYFGMFVDKYGIQWQISFDENQNA